AAVLLVDVEGLSYVEAGAIMGVPKGTGASRLAPPRGLLRRPLETPAEGVDERSRARCATRLWVLLFASSRCPSTDRGSSARSGRGSRKMRRSAAGHSRAGTARAGPCSDRGGGGGGFSAPRAGRAR